MASSAVNERPARSTTIISSPPQACLAQPNARDSCLLRRFTPHTALPLTSAPSILLTTSHPAAPCPASAPRRRTTSDHHCHLRKAQSSRSPASLLLLLLLQSHCPLLSNLLLLLCQQRPSITSLSPSPLRRAPLSSPRTAQRSMIPATAHCTRNSP